MSHYNENAAQPAYLKGFLWFAFSGTAMLSAFILPVHIWATMHGYIMNFGNSIFRLYFIVLFTAALYHGLYRVKTVIFDLGVTRGQKAIGWIATIIFFVTVITAVKMILFFDA